MATKRRWRITEEEARADALKCTTKTEFATRFSGSWRHLCDKGLLESACKHFTGHQAWTPEKVIAIAHRYKTRNAFKKGNVGGYCYASANNLLEQCYSLMGPPETVGRKPGKKMRKKK